MQRTTHQWMIFGAALGGGLLLLGVADLIVRYLSLTLTLAVFAYMVSRSTSPLCYTINRLRAFGGRGAGDLVQVGIPLVFLAALVFGTCQNREHGFWAAAAFTFLVLYVVDRLAALLIRVAAGYWSSRQAHRREQFEARAQFMSSDFGTPPDVDEPVDGDTIEGEAVR